MLMISSDSDNVTGSDEQSRATISRVERNFLMDIRLPRDNYLIITLFK